MTKVDSNTVEKVENGIQISFSLHDTVEKHIEYVTNSSINTFEVAKSKATSMLLEKCFNKDIITVSIPFVSNLNVGDDIEIDDSIYVVEKLTYNSLKLGITIKVIAFRYWS